MKEEDIDKIFRDALADQKAPTDESDWAAFEGMLDSRSTGLSKWTVIIALFILISGSSAAYIFLYQPAAEYIPRTQNSKLITQENENAEEIADLSGDTKEISDHSSNSKTAEIQEGNSSEQLNPANILAPSESDASENAKPKSPFETSNNEKGVVSNPSQPFAESSHSNDNKASQNSGINELRSSSFTTSETSQSENPAILGTRASKWNDTEPMATSTRPSKAALLSADQASGSFDIELGELKFMSSLGTEFEKELKPDLVIEKRSVPQSKAKLFSPFIYFKLEQNSVFQTSPALGLGLERSFPFKGKGALAIQGAIGYQRTGRLAWEQTSQNVTYGFDRYVEESNLKTENLEMIQIPIRVSYQSGVHRIFAGAEMNWLVNASQEFRLGSEGSTEQGYLYESGAPNSALFFQLGYGYALNEKFQLDFGFNIAGNSWVVVDKRPMGGLIRLNYFIR